MVVVLRMTHLSVLCVCVLLLARNILASGVVTLVSGNVNSLPQSIDPLTTTMKIEKTQIQEMTSLEHYNLFHLNTLSIVNNKFLNSIGAGALKNLPHLNKIILEDLPELTMVPHDIFSNLCVERLIFRKVPLRMIPSLGDMACSTLGITEITMHDFSITDLTKGMFADLKVGKLDFSGSSLKRIRKKAFFGLEVTNLILADNIYLDKIEEEAFEGCVKIVKLDLSGTSITSLPSFGLSSLKELVVERVPTLLSVPVRIAYPQLETAKLPYSYLCCGLQRPSVADPVAWKKFLEGCKDGQSASVMEEHNRHKRDFGRFGNQSTLSVVETTKHKYGSALTEKAVELNNISCKIHFSNLICYPLDDAFNPCEDLLGNWALRIITWIISITAIIANATVILFQSNSLWKSIRNRSHSNLVVSQFLICNLCTSDFCTGVYLFSLAVADTLSYGEYFNFATEWQLFYGCKFSGFFAIFGYELSLYILCVLSVERWYTITNAMDLKKRLKLSQAFAVVATGWLFSLIMASLPLVGTNSYSNTSICLPMDLSKLSGQIYAAVVLLINLFGFVIICACYLDIFRKVSRNNNGNHRNDASVAKRMAIIVFSNFLCWAPIALFATTAALGLPLVGVTQSKYLLVFFFPINSCANPFLYALLTRTFRRDVILWMNRRGYCNRLASKFRGAYIDSQYLHQTSEKSKSFNPHRLRQLSRDSRTQISRISCNE